MRSSVSASWLISAFAAVASATTPLATVTPCPSCPTSVAPAHITITSQYQPVSTCVPSTTCSTVTKGASKSCKVVPSCSTYDWVSTTIPCEGGTTSTVVTKTDQVIKLSHVSEVLTFDLPCPTATAAPYRNGTAPLKTSSSCTSKSYQTMVLDINCPYNSMGPMAMPPWGGSGLCGEKCEENSAGSKSQGVTVTKCLDGACSTYSETWVSAKPAPATSTSTGIFSSSTYLSSSGVHTIPAVTTCTPSGAGFTAPVTSSFTITTSVDKPQSVELTHTVTVTYSAAALPATQSSSATSAISTTASCPTNGVYTIPIVHTATPTHPDYTAPVTTTAYYTTTVTNAPTQVACTKTITITYYSTVCPATVVSGTTKSPSSVPTAPATISASPTSSSGGQVTSSAPASQSASTTSVASPTPSSTLATSTSGTSSSSGSSTSSGPSSAHGGTQTHPGHPSGTGTHPGGQPTSPPSGPSIPDTCSYSGCFSSPDGFKNFQLFETSGSNSPAFCTSECTSAGFPYSGLYEGDCYCSSTLGNCDESNTPGQCSISCPGSKSSKCGGKGLARRGGGEGGKLFDIYECPLPTSTSTSATEVSQTTGPTPEPSSDADSEEWDKEHEHDKDHKGDNEWKGGEKKNGSLKVKVRRGGVLKGNKVEKANLLAKRDFGVKRPFGF